MEAIRTYFLSVTAAAIICAILKGLLNQGGTPAQLVKLLSGIFLSIIALRPLAQFDLGSLTGLSFDYSMDVEAAVAEGENIAADALAELIKSNTEAYILDKARSMGVNITVDVTVNEEQIPAPKTVSICGNVSPYARRQLSALLTEQLGIAKEDLIWTG